MTIRPILEVMSKDAFLDKPKFLGEFLCYKVRVFTEYGDSSASTLDERVLEKDLQELFIQPLSFTSYSYMAVVAVISGIGDDCLDLRIIDHRDGHGRLFQPCCVQLLA